MVRSIILFLIFGPALMVPALSAYAGDVTYRSKIKPLFEAKCGACHGQDAPEYGDFEKDKMQFSALSKGPRMDSYPHLIFFIGWPDNGAMMRRLDDGRNTKDGKPGNMYQYLGASDEERQTNLALFKEWIKNWNLKKWQDVTKEEMNGLRVEY